MESHHNMTFPHSVAVMNELAVHRIDFAVRYEDDTTVTVSVPERFRLRVEQVVTRLDLLVA